MSAPPLTIGYAGSLAYGYGEALVALIAVLRDVPGRILISTPRPPDKLKALLEASDVVEWLPHRSDINDMWRVMQARADAMILPYLNPAGPYELLYRTHFPSKLTEYLALGIPVIVSGPDFATGVRWAKAEKLSRGLARQPPGKNEQSENPKHQSFQNLSISEVLSICPNGALPCASREELVEVLRLIKENGALRKELASRAVEAGKRDFDPVRIRQHFWSVLAEVGG